MKRTLLILSVVLAVVVVTVGITPALADDNGDNVKQVKPSCNEWLMGTIEAKSGTAGNGTIELASQKGDIEVTISVSGDTVYRAWLAPWGNVTFESLEVGDWIAICVEDGLAKLVILLEPPQKPFCLKLVGNVTAVTGNLVTVTTAQGTTYTVDLSNVGGNFTGALGQPVTLSIGRCVPFLSRCFPGLHLGWFIGKGNQGVGPWIKNKDFQGKLETFREKFRERYERRFERGQERFGD
jgi:hypothetical protein